MPHSSSSLGSICLALYGAAALARAQTGVRLSGDLPHGVNGDVVASTVGGMGMSPDGAWSVYRADAEVDERFDLLSVPTAGGAVRKLNANVPLSITGFAISADSTHVVFSAFESFTVERLFSVPIDGAAPALELAPLQALADIGHYAISPDSTTVALLSGPTSDQHELHVVPVTGGVPILVGTQVSPFGLRLEHGRVLFRSSAFTAQPSMFEVLSAPLDGGAPAVVLNATLPLGARVTSFALTPDGSTVVYLANPDSNKYQLYGVPHDLSAPAQLLHDPFATSGSVTSYAIDPTGARLVYIAPQLVANRHELFVVDLPAGGNNLELSGPFPPLTNSVAAFEIDPTGARVAYSAGSRLYVVPIDGSQAAIELDTNIDDFRFTPDGQFVLYLESGTKQLLAVAASGTEAPVALAPGLKVEEFEISADQSTVTFLARLPAPSDTNLQLYELHWSAGMTLVRLNPPLATPQDVRAFALTPDGSRVVYRADQEVDERFELFGVLAHTPGSAQKLSGALAPSPFPIGDVLEQLVSSDGAYAVYQANQDDPLVYDLYAVRCDGSQPAFRLSDPSSGGAYFDFSIAHDASRVFYRQSSAGGPIELFAVPIDRSAAPIKLSGALAPTVLEWPHLVTTDDARVVFVAQLDAAAVRELFSVPSDASAQPTRLHAPLAGAQDVTDWKLSSDESRVLFIANLDLDSRFDLYAAPIDGTAAPTRLNAPMVANANVRAGHVVVTALGRVLYLADARVDGMDELYSAPEDGSGAAVRLNRDIAAGGDVWDAATSADGQRVLYLADEVNGSFELFCAPADGSSSAVRVSAALPAFGDVDQGAITPSGERVVYTADQTVDEKFELYSVASDGSDLRRLDQPSSSDVGGFRITPDGSRVVFFFGNTNSTRLHSVPVAGGPVTILSPQFGPTMQVWSFLIHQSGDVLFALRKSPTFPMQLFVVRQDGRFGARLVSPPDWPGWVDYIGGYTAPYRLTPAGDRALFLADRAGGSVLELFTTNLRKARRAPAPGRSVTASALRSPSAGAAWLLAPHANARAAMPASAEIEPHARAFGADPSARRESAAGYVGPAPRELR